MIAVSGLLLAQVLALTGPDVRAQAREASEPSSSEQDPPAETPEDRPFVPSEEVSADQEVDFPADI